MSSDLYISQLLCSRLCHDLVGAAGAINAGIELLNEDQSDISAPLGLMEKSAAQVTRRLSYFRVAFGFAGGADNPLSAQDARKIIEDYFAGGKISLNWHAFEIEDSSAALQSLSTKTLLNLLMISSDCLPRGGNVQIHVAPLDDGMGIALEAFGQNARFADELRLALQAQADSENLSARNIHVYFANQLTKSSGGSLEVEVAEGSVQIACILKDGK